MTNYIIVTEEVLSKAPEDAIIQFVTKAFETQDAFIFETIRPFCENRTNMTITKDELIKALTLLKEQEPVKPKPTGIEPHYLCGKCKLPILNGDTFCKWCGRRIAWPD